MSIEIARGCTEGCRFCQAGMIYRPGARARPGADRPHDRQRREKSGYDEASLTSLSTADYSCIAPLVKKVADALDARAGERWASPPARLRPRRERARRHGARARDRRDVRPRGGHAAHARRHQQERDRGAAPADGRAGLLARVVGDEALLHDRPAHRGGGGRPRHRRRSGAARAPSASASRTRAGRAGHAEGHGERLDARAQAAHAVPVVRDGRPERDPRRSRAGSRKRRARAGVELRTHDGETSWLEAVFARGDRSLAAVLERAYRAGARFDSWEDQKKMSVWEDAFRAEGIDPRGIWGRSR